MIREADAIPADEDSIIFVSTVLGADDPASGITILDQHIASGSASDAAANLRQQLVEFQEGGGRWIRRARVTVLSSYRERSPSGCDGTAASAGTVERG